jgi:hypothetical protein
MRPGVRVHRDSNFTGVNFHRRRAEPRLTAAVDMIWDTSHMLLSSNAGRPELATAALWENRLAQTPSESVP